MKCKEEWQPSKFILRNGKLRASRNPNEVGISSRLAADLVAQFYDTSLKKHAKGHLLDLGCGKVPLYEAYKNLIENNTCVDWENSLHVNSYLDYSFDLNQKIPLPDEAYDTIILSDVLEHIKNPFLLWSELFRMLKNNGILILNVPFFYWIHEEPHDYFRYTEYALRLMAEENKFEIIELKPLGGAPEILTDILAKLAMKFPFAGKYVAMLLQKTTWLLTNTKFGRKVSLASSHKFPFGYAVIARKTS